LRWLELSVTTAPASREAVAEKMIVLGAGGVSLEEAADWERARLDGLGDIFPEAIPTDRHRVIIRGYFTPSLLADGRLAELELFLSQLPEFGLAPATLALNDVDDATWESSWKDYWQPTPVGNTLVIVPAWLEGSVWPGRKVLLLDPGPAFGTGAHETTRLCLELLERQLAGGETVFDLGCGSGILAIAAALLGAAFVYGVDREEVAVRASRENAALNSLGNVTFRQADLNDDLLTPAVLPRGHLLLANLTADLLPVLSGRLHRLLCQGGRIIASGIIRGRAAEVAGAFAAVGYRLLEEKSAGEWTALLLEMKE